MAQLLTERGHFSYPFKTLPELIQEVFGPGAYLQTDMLGGGVIYSPTVIDGEPVALETVLSFGERETAGG